MKLSDLGTLSLPGSSPALPASEAPIYQIPARSLERSLHPKFHLLPPPNCLLHYYSLAPYPTTRVREALVRVVRTQR
jgi:hypothetical protein